MIPLKNRLNRLRQPLAATEKTDDTDITGIAHIKATPQVTTDVLRSRLNRARPHATIPAQYRKTHLTDDQTIAELLGGEVLQEGVILVEHTLPLPFKHGDQTFHLFKAEQLHCLVHTPNLSHKKCFFMDTETSGLSGGSGTIAFLLGIAKLDNDSLIVRQYFLTAFAGEPAMLDHSAKWLNEDQGIMTTYNGKSFDAPLLSTRYRLNKLIDPYPKLPHLDLLHPIRRAFANSWPNCRLATVEQQLLGFERVDDIPGAEVPEIWFELIRFGITERLPAVLKHNYWDIISMVAILPILVNTYEQPDSAANVLGIAKHYLQRGEDNNALELLRKNKTNLCVNGWLALAHLHQRQLEWSESVSIWKSLAADGCLEAVEKLAKYYEHNEHNLSQALIFTQQLTQQTVSNASHQHRATRLMNKMAKNL